MLKRNTLLAAAIALACSVSFTTHAAEDSRSIEIPAGDLTIALESLARQAGIELVYRMDQVSGVKTKGVRGELSPREAVQKLLEDTPLELRVDPSGAMLIAAPAEPANASAKNQRTTRTVTTDAARDQDSEYRLRLAQATRADSTAAVSGTEPEESELQDASASTVNLEEVVVTGSQIRGATPVGSPVITLDRQEIARAGVATVQQLIATLPQNFGGDASEDVRTTGANTRNTNGGTGVNLRGLGSSATLVLVNGRRLPQTGGASGSYVDISNIPLSAVERVEVLTDGASAIYGSDAVAGVINFVLRSDFDGAETQARFGSVTSGGMREGEIAHTFGKSWDRGSVLITLDYYERGNLRGRERPFWGNQD